MFHMSSSLNSNLKIKWVICELRVDLKAGDVYNLNVKITTIGT